MAPDVSILIISHNTGPLTVACLESLPAGTGGLDTEVIVVDNASTDDSVALIRDRFPQVRLLPQDENLGFGPAVNLAAEQAAGEFLLLLNPDTVVLERSLERLVEFARAHPEHGVYGGRTLRPDRSLDPSSCWGAPTLWSHVCFGLGLSTLFRGSRLFDPDSLGRWQRDSVRPVGVVTGCLLLIPRKVFEALGGFDPRYFMYGEDVDLSVRARRAGWNPVITPDAVIIHHVGASSSNWADKHVLVMRGKTTLARTHWTGWRRRLCLEMLRLGVALRGVLGVAAAAAGRRPRRSDWPELWRRRAQWWPGYQAVPSWPKGGA